MGVAPPTDYDAPPDKTEVPTTTGMADSLPANEICGFKLPTVDLLKLLPALPKIPSISLPSIPSFLPALSINCSTSNPISITAPWGGNRPSSTSNTSSNTG